MTDVTAFTATPDATTQGQGRSLHIVIPGGGGHLGRLLTRYFLGRGHYVTTLTRRRSGPPGVHESRVTTREPWHSATWDGVSLGSWVETLEGADVLMNLAGRSVDCRYNAKNRDEILRSRVDSTSILGKAVQALKHPPRVWLNASTATIYRHTFEQDMDEHSGELGGDEPDAPVSWRFSTEVARQWESALFSAQTPGTRKVALRTAMVMSSEPGGIFEIVLRLVRMGLGGAWGSGRQYVSWIHTADFVRAVEFLIEREDIVGVVNPAAPVPLPNREFMAALRRAWGTAIGLPTTEGMLEVGAFLLRTETELLLKSRRVVPGILRQKGFEFLFPEWPEAARDLVERWRAHRQTARNDQGGST